MTGTILTASGAGNNSKAGEERGMVQLSPLWHFGGPSLKALVFSLQDSVNYPIKLDIQETRNPCQHMGLTGFTPVAACSTVP